jgi:hypothetical protein
MIEMERKYRGNDLSKSKKNLQKRCAANRRRNEGFCCCDVIEMTRDFLFWHFSDVAVLARNVRF